MINFLITITFILCITLIFFISASYRKKLLDQQKEISTLKKILSSAANEVAEFERERIAKSLHDDVGMLLTVVKLNLNKISRNPQDKIFVEKLLEESMHLLSESCEAIRVISTNLIPPSLVQIGYEKSIAELCRQINISEKIKIKNILSNNEVRLPSLVELHLYRITQEIINNIIKHENPTEIKIEINSDKNGVRTLIIHNGKGITSDAIKQLRSSGNGAGLKSIENRSQLIAASIDYFSNDNNESKIIIYVPVYEKKN
jgi:signal transduction histidine kinase